MKKQTITAALAIVSASLVLTGCTITPHVNVDVSGNINGSEVISESFSYEPNTSITGAIVSGKGGNAVGENGSENPSENPGEGQFPGGLDDDGKNPNEGKFPGGLDDDGFGPDEAVSVLFKVEHNSDKAAEKAVITGLNMDGGPVWTYETKEDYIGQVDNLEEIGYFDGKYIFLAFGDVIALDLQTGKELWVNHDFKGAGMSWTTDYEGEKLYMCGYFGPDLFVMDLNGKTLNRITGKDDDTYWAYKIEYINAHQVDVTYESTEKAVSYDPEGPSEQ